MKKPTNKMIYDCANDVMSKIYVLMIKADLTPDHVKDVMKAMKDIHKMTIENMVRRHMAKQKTK